MALMQMTRDFTLNLYMNEHMLKGVKTLNKSIFCRLVFGFLKLPRFKKKSCNGIRLFSSGNWSSSFSDILQNFHFNIRLVPLVYFCHIV